MSLQDSDDEAAAVAVAPRVTLADMKAKISAQYDFTADKALGEGIPIHDALCRVSICILVMQNGFVLIGKSAPASPANFNAELGRKLAYEDAIRQLWPLEGYALSDRLTERAAMKASS
jgi:hypothetical protein